MNREDYTSKELAMRERAKMYLDKLISGINPVDNTPITDDSVVHNPKVKNCFKYLSDYIGEINSKERRRLLRGRRVNPFYLSAEQRLHIPIVNDAVSVSEFTDNINSIAKNDTMKPLKATSVTQWLVEKGFLDVVKENGSNKKLPSQAGLQIGIFTETRHSARNHSEYLAVFYSKEAQQFIADNIGEIIEINNAKKQKKSE